MTQTVSATLVDPAGGSVELTKRRRRGTSLVLAGVAVAIAVAAVVVAAGVGRTTIGSAEADLYSGNVTALHYEDPPQAGIRLTTPGAVSELDVTEHFVGRADDLRVVERSASGDVAGWVIQARDSAGVAKWSLDFTDLGMTAAFAMSCTVAGATTVACRLLTQPTQESRIVGFSAMDGRELFSVPVEMVREGDFSATPDGGILYMHSVGDEHTLRRLDAVTGEEVWASDLTLTTPSLDGTAFRSGGQLIGSDSDTNWWHLRLRDGSGERTGTTSVAATWLDIEVSTHWGTRRQTAAVDQQGELWRVEGIAMPAPDLLGRDGLMVLASDASTSTIYRLSTGEELWTAEGLADSADHWVMEGEVIRQWDTGHELTRAPGRLIGLGPEHAYFQDADDLVALDRWSLDVVWRTDIRAMIEDGREIPGESILAESDGLLIGAVGKEMLLLEPNSTSGDGHTR